MLKEATSNPRAMQAAESTHLTKALRELGNDIMGNNISNISKPETAPTLQVLPTPQPFEDEEFWLSKRKV
jgi:hypothetical protein